MKSDLLLLLTPTQLQPVKGERRNRLIAYLQNAGEYPTLLHYLEVWLGGDPHLATLRQARAEVLVALGQPEAALAELDALDAERGTTAGRRALRLDALVKLGEWEAAHVLIDLEVEDSTARARMHGDLLFQQGEWSEAATAYTAAGIDLNGEADPNLYAVRLALAFGHAHRAHTILQQLYQRKPEAATTRAHLHVEREIAEQRRDQQTITRINAELARYRVEQQQSLLESLHLDPDDETSPLIAERELVPVAVEHIAAGTVAPEAYALLQTHWGYADFRGQQAAVVSNMLAGRNTLAVLPTGAGKSLCYQLPAFLLDGATIVVSPLIALMKDQVDGLPAGLRSQATAINSSLRGDEVPEVLAQVRAGRFKLVYVAPERLRQQSFVQALRQAGIARFVVDEAHCVSLWGLSFRPDYLFLKRVLHELGNPPVLALTATATPETQREIEAQFGQLKLVTASIFRSNLHFSVIQSANSQAKEQALIELCHQNRGAIVVYARARDKCEALAAMLRDNGIKAAHYHAQVDDRARVQEQFMRGEVRVLVATIAFGMGVDKADVRMIVHYNLPQSIEAYYQEAGRAGRDGKPAECVLLYTSSDKGQLTSWLRQDALDKDDLRMIYKTLRRYARHDVVAIHTDTLLHALPRRGDHQWWNETQLRVVLGMLERVGLVVRHFDLPTMMSVTLHTQLDEPDFKRFAHTLFLRPAQRTSFAPLDTAEACEWRPDELEARLLRWQASGALSYQGTATDLLLQLLPPPSDTAVRIDRLLGDYDDRQNARINAMAGYAQGLNCRHRALAKHFGELLPACGGVCDICAGQVTATPSLNVAVDESLYHALESWRRQTAQQRGVPSYIVFANATLRDIASVRPRTLKALSAIRGVGPKTLDQYGPAVLSVIAAQGEG
ncbi:MAG: RecQ family ATP-dependent DNA helicase [Herpetosiphonaceae bacterium]|nr:RecQ family ATP-dependent DNA helicase [Herpetosiphonaceae bacterium]